MDTEKRGCDLGKVSGRVTSRRKWETHAEGKVDKAGYCLIPEFLIQYSRADDGLDNISLKYWYDERTTSPVGLTGQGEEDKLRRNNLLPQRQHLHPRTDKTRRLAHGHSPCSETA